MCVREGLTECTCFTLKGQGAEVSQEKPLMMLLRRFIFNIETLFLHSRAMSLVPFLLDRFLLFQGGPQKVLIVLYHALRLSVFAVGHQKH